MSEKRILTAKCPCGVTLQVKTRSLEKIVTCPKCGASMTVSALPGAAPAELPFAAVIEEPASLPMAEPMTAMPMAEPLPFAQPLAAAPRCSRRQIAVAGSIAGGVLAAAVLVIVLQPGAGQLKGSSSPSVSANYGDGTPVEAVTSQQASLVSQPQEDGQQDANDAVQSEEPAVAKQGLSKPKSPQQQQNNSANPGGNYFDTLSKLKAKQGLIGQPNFGGNSFQGGGFQNLNPGVREQQRNWDLANSGRLGAMGLKKVTQPRR